MDQNNMGQNNVYQQENFGGQPQNPYIAPIQPQQAYQPPAGSDDVSMGEWMWTTLLLAIPIVNFVLMLVWAFGGDTKPSKANYCKAALLWMLIGFCLSIVLSIVMIFLGIGLFSSSFLTM